MNNELNERIAAEVMGYEYGVLPGVCVNKWWKRLPDGYLDVRYQGLPDYSGDIAAAWLVVEELAKRDTTMELDYVNKVWSCCFYDYEREGIADCKSTAPLAIVYAALDICEKMKANAQP